MHSYRNELSAGIGNRAADMLRVFLLKTENIAKHIYTARAPQFHSILLCAVEGYIVIK